MNCEDNDFLDSAWTAYRRPWFLADGSSRDATINLVDDNRYRSPYRGARIYETVA